MSKNTKGNKIGLFIGIIIAVLAVAGVIGIIYINKNKPKEEPTKEVKILNSIDEYGITLSDMDSSLYKEEYEVLKKNLLSDRINYKEYAESISKLFIIDLYTLSTKLNKFDVGGSEVVYPPILENYKVNVEDTLYKYLEDNSKGNRKQQLPKVKSIKVVSTKEEKYKITSEDKTYDGYKIVLKWDYEKDLGYDTEATLNIIKVDNKLYVVEKN
ncbi:MAG: hypothetical protein IKP76_03340 [Bacilli bacterium]|nr:hypothetical protein [Bacilli bacterium]